MYTVFEAIALKMTVMTLFVMALKLLFKNKLTARMHCMIWLLLCIQLFFCIGDIQIQTDTSIYSAMPEISAAPVSFNFKPIICMIWLAGAIVFALWHIFTYVLYMHQIHRLPMVTEAGTLARLKAIRTSLGIYHSRKITLRIGKSAQTLSNTIILPDNFSVDEEYHILLHELCHFRYHDNLKLWLALAMLCVSWFNPVMWLAFRMFRTDIEMLCDERVIKITQNKREYAEALVKSSAMHRRFVPGAISASNGKREVFARIKRIVKFNRMKPIWLIAAALGCGVIAAICLTVPKETVQIINELSVPTQEAVVPDSVPSEALEIAIDTPTAAPVIVTADSAAPMPTAEERPSTVRKQSKKPASKTAASETVPSSRADVSSNTDSAVSRNAPGIGTRESVSGNGSKETYLLDNGNRAVVQYDDGEVTSRYIIVE